MWTLTDAGQQTRIDQHGALDFFQKVQRKWKNADTVKENDETQAPIDELKPEDQTFREEMIKFLHSISPDGFERLCKLTLREVGFEEVTVTGKTGDGGIDGFGILRINRLVTDRVLFQCKRHTKQVSPVTSASSVGRWPIALSAEFSRYKHFQH